MHLPEYTLCAIMITLSEHIKAQLLHLCMQHIFPRNEMHLLIFEMNWFCKVNPAKYSVKWRELEFNLEFQSLITL